MLTGFMHAYRSLRLVACLSAVLLTGASLAERFISIPTGQKTPYRGVRLMAFSERSDAKEGHWALGIGVTPLFEVEFTYDTMPGASDRLSMDLTYNVIDPLINMSPGISFGVRDALDQSKDGAGAYAAITYHVGNEDPHNQNTPTAATFGILLDSRGGRVFTGVSQPFTDQVLLVVEHDGERLIGGFEYRPFPNGSIRWLHMRSGQAWQASLTKRF
jgi:hypothetical protein